MLQKYILVNSLCMTEYAELIESIFVLISTEKITPRPNLILSRDAAGYIILKL